MTKEEAIQVLRDWDGYFIGHGSDDVNEALNMAIEALEKEPCEDCISRQEAIDAVIDLCRHYTPTKSVNHPHVDFVIEALQKLPSVTPKKKTGKWMQAPDAPNCYWCSECGCYRDSEHDEGLLNFCPNCGAKMVEPQESEVSE